MTDPRSVEAPAPGAFMEDFRAAFDSAAIGMAVVAFDGRFLEVNPALCTLLARSRADLLRTTWAAVSHPDDVPFGAEQAQKMERGEQDTFQFEKRYLLPDGGLVWAMLNVSSIRDSAGTPVCLFTQVVDLTDYRKGEEAKRRLAAIADASDDAIVGCGIDGTVIAWNRGAENMYGYTAQEAVGRHITLIVPPERRRELECHLERAQGTGGRFPCLETVCQPKHGPPIEVAVTLSPIRDGEGGVTGVSLVARDITEQRWLAHTLDSALVALEDALAVARESEHRSRRFLADAAHQLRTPITGIQACAETLLRGAPPREVDRLLMNLVRETSRASRLMASLLRMARLDQGEPLLPRSCNVAALCEDEVDRARALAPSLTLSTRILEMEEIRPSFDTHALREILANLLDNARRHATSRIEVSVRHQANFLRIEVTDDGPGLTEDATLTAFERFVTLDGAGGSGLGLPIARDLARAHGGDLTYEDGRFVIVLVEPVRAPVEASTSAVPGP